MTYPAWLPVIKFHTNLPMKQHKLYTQGHYTYMQVSDNNTPMFYVWQSVSQVIPILLIYLHPYLSSTQPELPYTGDSKQIL